MIFSSVVMAVGVSPSLKNNSYDSIVINGIRGRKEIDKKHELFLNGP
jgi:hypothetical protein